MRLCSWARRKRRCRCLSCAAIYRRRLRTSMQTLRIRTSSSRAFTGRSGCASDATDPTRANSRNGTPLADESLGSRVIALLREVVAPVLRERRVLVTTGAAETRRAAAAPVRFTISIRTAAGDDSLEVGTLARRNRLTWFLGGPRRRFPGRRSRAAVRLIGSGPVVQAGAALARWLRAALPRVASRSS